MPYVYKFICYDIYKEEFIESKRYAKIETINEIRAIASEKTKIEIDEKYITYFGMTDIDFDPERIPEWEMNQELIKNTLSKLKK